MLSNMKPVVYIELPEAPAVLLGVSKDYFAVNLRCRDLPLDRVPYAELPQEAGSGEALRNELWRCAARERNHMKPVIYFDGATIPNRLVYETPDAFLVNLAYRDINIPGIADDELPLSANDREFLIKTLFHLGGKTMPEDGDFGQLRNPIVGKNFRLSYESLEAANGLLMELQDMAAGIADAGIIVQDFSGNDCAEKMRSLFRLLSNTAADMGVRIFTVIDYVEATAGLLEKIDQSV